MALPPALRRHELDALLRSPLHRQVHGGDIVIQAEISGDGRITMKDAAWLAGPRGSTLIARCGNGCHWIARLPEDVRTKGQAVAESIPELDGLLRRMRRRAFGRLGCR